MTGGRALAAVGLVAFLAFAFQIARSPFLAIERGAGLAEQVASEVDLPVTDVMALREILGIGVDRDALIMRARAFRRDLTAYGSEALAAVAAAGDRELVDRLLHDAGGDARAAEAALMPRPEAIWAVRFRSVRERFASRRR